MRHSSNTYYTSWATRLSSGFLLSALSLCVSLYLCLYSLSLPKLTLNILPADQQAHPSLSRTHPSLSLSHPSPFLFPDKKFPVEAHFWLDELFYYIDNSTNTNFP